MAGHERVRGWRTLWRSWCGCGARRWPCPDTNVATPQPAAYWLSNLPLERIRDMHREGPAA
jgi:hypothetical protein